MVTLMACGVVAAAQVGKAAAALPVVQEQFAMSLTLAALNLSVISLIGAVGGGLMGLLVPVLGYRRQLQVGLLVIVVMSLLGAAAPDARLLLVTRAGEGLGFILVILAAPEALRAVTAVGDRRLVMGMWGAYMPLGTGVAALLSPAMLASIGWRGVWVGGALSAGAVLFALTFTSTESGYRAATSSLRALRRAIRPDVLLLSGVFGLYAGQYMAVVGLLPALLQREAGMSLSAAGVVTAAAFLVNAPGNFLGAVLQHRGVAWTTLIIVGSLLMGVFVWLVYDHSQTNTVRIGAAILLSFTGGLVPSGIFGGMAALSGDEGSMGAPVGVLMQGSSVGQLIGPPAVASVGSAWAVWAAEPGLLCTAAASAVAGGLLLRWARARG